MKTIGGDVSFYLNMLNCSEEELQFSIVENTNTLLRSIGKIPAKIYKSALPNKINSWLFKYSRYRYIAKADLAGIDAIISHIIFPWLNPGVTTPIPIIWSSQGISPPSYYQIHQFTFSQVIDMYNYFSKKSDLLIIWTKSCADIMNKHCHITKPIEIIPPIAEIHFPKQKIPKQTKFHMLFVGREPQRKGFYDVLDSYYSLSEDRKEITFDIVSLLPDKIIAQLKADPNINYYSNISNELKAQLMDRADLLILPTYAETYGFILIEGMAHRCALITSNYEPLNELVKEPENGFLIQPGNVKEIAQKIKLLYENQSLLTEISENNYKKYLINFSKKAVIPKYKEALKQLLQR